MSTLFELVGVRASLFGSDPIQYFIEFRDHYLFDNKVDAGIEIEVSSEEGLAEHDFSFIRYACKKKIHGSYRQLLGDNIEDDSGYFEHPQVRFYFFSLKHAELLAYFSLSLNNEPQLRTGITDELYLKFIWVNENLRNKGIGSFLMGLISHATATLSQKKNKVFYLSMTTAETTHLMCQLSYQTGQEQNIRHIIKNKNQLAMLKHLSQPTDITWTFTPTTLSHPFYSSSHR